MRNFLWILLLAHSVGCKKHDSASNTTTPPPSDGYSTPTSYPNMALVWDEEFNETTLNPSYWNYQLGNGCPDVCGWGNSELEYYKQENTKVDNGYLVIEAKAETAGGFNYTSSRLTTQDKFNVKFGRIDVRAKLPKGQGIWPAVWLLGKSITTVSWPACGEIDIMEMIGGAGKENTIYGTGHWKSNGNHTSSGGSYSLTSETFNDKFYVFSIIWNAQKIAWYVDDVKFHELDITPIELSAFQQEFYLLINIAVGGSWPGNPVTSTTFPQKLYVDYVRVFQ